MQNKSRRRWETAKKLDTKLNPKSHLAEQKLAIKTQEREEICSFRTFHAIRSYQVKSSLFYQHAKQKYAQVGNGEKTYAHQKIPDYALE